MIRSRWAGAALGLAIASASGAAVADVGRVPIDRVAVRFYSPETGGAAEPRFIDERTLAFEARLETMSEKPGGIGDDFDERSVRAAMDHHMGEELLATLALKLIAGTPPDKRPTEASLASVQQLLGAALFERLGGEARVTEAADAEHLARYEVDDILRRQALAAWYVDRALSPILKPSEEQLREVLRTGANPYRGRSFDEVRGRLERWFVSERIRVAETSFLQGVRSRLKVMITP